MASGVDDSEPGSLEWDCLWMILPLSDEQGGWWARRAWGPLIPGDGLAEWEGPCLQAWALSSLWKFMWLQRCKPVICFTVKMSVSYPCQPGRGLAGSPGFPVTVQWWHSHGAGQSL